VRRRAFGTNARQRHFVQIWVNLRIINLIERGGMKNTFVTISLPGPNRDLSKGTREQPLWDEHAAFIDQLVAEGFVLMGGPLVDEDGAMLIVNAGDENEVREKLKNDPWMKHGVLKLESVKRWQIFVDVRK
jgi:uncharacterized protein YciI